MKRKIMIVEDDEDVAKGLKVRLEANGYATVRAADAGAGIKLALEEQPDLIILDLGLPDNNGFMMMKKMQGLKRLSSIPVIVVTGRPAEVYEEPVLIAGAKGYLQKPVDNNDLLAMIRKELPVSP